MAFYVIKIIELSLGLFVYASCTFMSFSKMYQKPLFFNYSLSLFFIA